MNFKIYTKHTLLISIIFFVYLDIIELSLNNKELIIISTNIFKDIISYYIILYKYKKLLYISLKICKYKIINYYLKFFLKNLLSLNNILSKYCIEYLISKFTNFKIISSRD